jgi:nucleoside-diphosphate-sugar epimerase
LDRLAAALARRVIRRRRVKVLFIGGTGVISTACTKLALERGMDLTHLNRGTGGAAPAGVETLVADVRQPGAAARALAGRSFDAVVDWIAYTPDDIRRDLELFAGRTDQFIFISSATVYRRPPPCYIVTEETPLENAYWQYAREKIACEELLRLEHREHGFPATIVRPSSTYGPTKVPTAIGSGHTVLDRLRRGRPVLVHGDGQSLWTLTHNTDFAKAFVGLLGNQRAVGEAFHITSDEVLTWDEIYRTVARAAGAGEPKLVHLASETIARLHPPTGEKLLGDRSSSMVFDNSKIKRFVPDFQATTFLEAGVRQSLAWLDADPSRLKPSAEENAWMDRLVEMARK